MASSEKKQQRVSLAGTICHRRSILVTNIATSALDNETEREIVAEIQRLKGEKTMIELAQEFDVHPNQIKQWRDQLLEGATGVFGEALKAEPEPTIDVKTLHAKIGELTLENDFLSGALGKAGLLPSAKK